MVRADNGNEVSDVVFSQADATVGVGYAMTGGQIAVGAPQANGVSQRAVQGATPDQLNLYWHNGVTWVKVGGINDVTNQAMKTQTSRLGRFQLRVGARATSLSLDKGNVYPRVITPNGDGLNDRVYFVFENPNGSSVNGEILDTQGRHIANLSTDHPLGVGTT